MSMGFMNLFRRAPGAGSVTRPRAMAGESGVFENLNDPAFYEFLRAGGYSTAEAGIPITAETALRNTTVLRCISLISRSIGMLPLHLRNRETKEKAADHPLFRLLHRKPNGWQTAYQFRVMQQQQALIHGDAIALIVRSGPRIIQLVPILRDQWEVKQRADWSLEYRVRGRVYNARDILHIREPLTEDGFTGVSRVRKAADAIALAIQTERSASRLFRQGLMVGGWLKTSGTLSPEAFARLSASLDAASGVEYAHRWKIIEEGIEPVPAQMPAKDNQAIENRRHQIEDIARAFDVPRPLLMIDDTSWGSGIDVLGQMFVMYGLNPWFEAWEQAVECSLLTDIEANRYEAKFNPGGLLRGSVTQQAEFWAKALGAGGQQPWATPEEAREAFDWPAIERGALATQMGQQQTGGANDPAHVT